ncbi:MAG: alpha-2-macroglobulin family protein, partial [Ferruginibacter sp.]
MTISLRKSSFLLLAITTFSITLLAQTKNNYSNDWKIVEALEQKGLTKSALSTVMAIYGKAIKDKNEAQQIKSSMYQVRFRNMVEEDSRENNIFFVDTLIAKAKLPARNILQSMQAEMLWQYLQNNRYKFYNRTKLAEENSKDISTWSIEKLHATISSLYKASLTNENKLKETKLDGYDPIIVKGQNTRQLRPTLYDFLAHRALIYFMNDERLVTMPAYNFTINDPKVFAPVNDFIKASFITKDTASLHYKALVLLQLILKFHLNDTNQNALLDADLIRLNFANQYATNENKTNLFEAALQNFEKTFAGNRGIAQAMNLRATIYYNKGQNFQLLTHPEYQYEIKRAKELCEAVIKDYPKTEGAVNAQNLLGQILQPSLSLETEKVNVPNQPFRTLVRYKNTRVLYFRVIKTSAEEIKKFDRNNYDKLWATITGLKPIKTWEVPMPDPNDYQQHATEIKIDALPVGTYIVLASPDKNFSLQKNIIAKQLTYISNISYVHNTNNDYNVLDRESGQPLPGTKVQVWETKYNYTTSRNELVKAEGYTTDKNGYFKLKQIKEYRNIELQLTTATDELFTDEALYSTNYNGYRIEQKPFTFLFTDRSIYRPGQMVYFKGIVIKKSGRSAETIILPGFKTVLVLKDANGQKLTELSLETNEYGSYHGSFKLPETGITGQFSLFDTSTNATSYFNVEEYKRPKFFTEVSIPTGTYRLFDSISVTGSAKAYAGNNIDGATVKFRVTRKVRYQPWWYAANDNYTRKIMPPGNRSGEMEITNGETTTGSNGEFHIAFKALPDETVNKKDQPIFYYEVSADITDINGETRNGNTSIAVGYQAIKLNIDMPDKLSVDSFKNLKILSTNINDIFENANVNVTLYKLKSPGKILRERFWEMPDQFVMSKDEYEVLFPYDIYKDEDQPGKWPLGEKLLDNTDSTIINGNWKLAKGPSAAGWYKITATTKDKFGEEVVAIKYFQLQDETASKPGVENPANIIVQQNGTEPGQKIKYLIKTGFEKIWLIHTLNKMDDFHNTTYHGVQQGNPFQNEIVITEQDRGGMALSYIFVQHNRVYKGAENFSIPWSNKELTISYATFRDKILPGSKEKWTAKIAGSKGEKLAAEMLVSMYDASLDQFAPQSWNALNLWPGLFNIINWSENGFSAVSSEEYNRSNYQYLDAPPKLYDRLLSVYLSNSFDDVVVVGYGTRRKKDIVGSTAAVSDMEMKAAPQAGMMISANRDATVSANEKEESSADTSLAGKSSAAAINNNNVQVRKNFNETAFFFPDLTTDAEGNVSFSFTIPEALTQWKLMTFAHTKALASGYDEKKVITQKPLMVQPNAPRFLREGDRMEFSAKIVNLSETEITGTSQLELLDAVTGKTVDGWFKNVFPNQYFTVAAGQSVAVKFPIEVPFNFNS